LECFAAPKSISAMASFIFRVPPKSPKPPAGQSDLLLVRIDGAKLGDSLKWEPSRGGALFPHLYGDLDLAAVTHVEPLPLGPGGHIFPTLDD